MFDAIFPAGRGNGEPKSQPLPPQDRERLRQLVRLAALLHDLGHAPLSHASEGSLPLRSQLDLGCFSAAERGKRATHEDYTVLLTLSEEIAPVIKQPFAGDVDPLDVCHLITGRFPQQQRTFVVAGVDYGPLLSQLVSGEMDADRIDYLQRDAFYAGVGYGKFDEIWLLNNLTHHIAADRAYLALSNRAIFAFEDFLLSRYHMFVSVYYHHTAVGLDTMLARYLDQCPGEISFPTAADEYVMFDDVALWHQLRRSRNDWARRISRRQLYRRVIELNPDPGTADIFALQRVLEECEIDCFVSQGRGRVESLLRPQR